MLRSIKSLSSALRANSCLAPLVSETRVSTSFRSRPAAYVARGWSEVPHALHNCLPQIHTDEAQMISIAQDLCVVAINPWVEALEVSAN
ncbi:MAG: hypothetical protein M3125_02265, partial [Gemmatimonadota bacterium]|nr:hypothetical protein [Gemmatimonadota bacterium]